MSRASLSASQHHFSALLQAALVMGMWSWVSAGLLHDQSSKQNASRLRCVQGGMQVQLRVNAMMCSCSLCVLHCNGTRGGEPSEMSVSLLSAVEVHSVVGAAHGTSKRERTVKD